MSKNVKGVIKLQLVAGKANPSPPVGPALGQYGVNIMGFCKEFNARTKDRGDTLIPVIITVYDDRSFDFIMKVPPVSYLIKKSMKIKKGSGNSILNKIGTISSDDVKKIALEKMPDLNARGIDSAISMVGGTARSMGVDIV